MLGTCRCWSKNTLYIWRRNAWSILFNHFAGRLWLATLLRCVSCSTHFLGARGKLRYLFGLLLGIFKGTSTLSWQSRSPRKQEMLAFSLRMLGRLAGWIVQSNTAYSFRISRCFLCYLRYLLFLGGKSSWFSWFIIT